MNAPLDVLVIDERDHARPTGRLAGSAGYGVRNANVSPVSRSRARVPGLVVTTCDAGERVVVSALEGGASRDSLSAIRDIQIGGCVRTTLALGAGERWPSRYSGRLLGAGPNVAAGP